MKEQHLKGLQTSIVGQIGHMHDDVILLLLPESFRVLLFMQITAFVIQTSLGLANLNMKEKRKGFLVPVVKKRYRAIVHCPGDTSPVLL